MTGSKPAAGAAEASVADAEPRYDVMLSLRPGVAADEVMQRATGQSAMPTDKIAALLKALSRQASLKVGADVPRSRADKARRDLEALGFRVELKPVLSLEALDPRIPCPHCGVKVEVAEDRLCPACGENVDKFDPKRKLAERIEAEERGRIERLMARDKDDMERRNAKAYEEMLRARIRAELEKEYGLSQPWRRRLMRVRGSLMVSGLLSLTLVAGVTGGTLMQVYGPALAGAPARMSADLEAALRLIDSRHERVAALGGAGASGASAAGVSEVHGPSLFGLAQQDRAQGQGVLMEQALAKTPWGPAASQPGVATGPLPVLPAADRRQLGENFALSLAQMGQSGRAREVLSRMGGDAGPVTPSTEVLVDAWSLGQPGAALSGAQVTALRSRAQGIGDPVDQVRALSGSAAALSQSGQVPPAVAEAFMQSAAETVNTLADPGQRATAMDLWHSAMGDMLLARAMLRAKSGDVQGAQAAVEQLDVLRHQVPAGPAAAHLGGLHHQALLRLGQPDKARQVLVETLMRLQEVSGVVAQAEFLRQIGKGCGAFVPDELVTAAISLSRKASEAPEGQRNQAYLTLARLAILAGRSDSASQWREQAEQKLPADSAQRARLQAGWLVGEQLDLADRAQRAGRVGESEKHVRKVAAYLL